MSAFREVSQIDLGKMKSGGAIYAVVDSTGLKVFGEGE